jgi:hypothetical protein
VVGHSAVWAPPAISLHDRVRTLLLDAGARFFVICFICGTARAFPNDVVANIRHATVTAPTFVDEGTIVACHCVVVLGVGFS